jgi:transcriptional regulator with XRE-family HTH domain
MTKKSYHTSKGEYAINVSKVAKRLKNLRTEQQITFEELANKLNKRYPFISISVDTLKKYEVYLDNRSRTGAVSGMRIEYLYMLADFYNVSADYILGRINYKTHENTDIYELTGLSEKAIEVLKLFKKR